jgi:hypothetical protein
VNGVLLGFVTIGVVIAAGMLLAHLRVLDVTAQRTLTDVAFFVASPALMLTTLARADVGAVLTRNLVATVAGARHHPRHDRERRAGDRGGHPAPALGGVLTARTWRAWRCTRCADVVRCKRDA